MLMQDGASEAAEPSTKVLETKVKLSPSTEPRNPTEESRAPIAHTTSPLARDLTPLKIWPALLGSHFSVLPRPRSSSQLSNALHVCHPISWHWCSLGRRRAEIVGRVLGLLSLAWGHSHTGMLCAQPG